MRISIRHETRYDYGEPAAGVFMRLRLWPRTTNGQQVEDWRVSVNGEPVRQLTANGYGDGESVWRAPGRVGSVAIVAEGGVATVDCAGVTRAVPGEVRPRLFLRETPLTRPDAALRALAEAARSPQGDLASLHALCVLVNEAVPWRADSTTVDTIAAEALAQRAGVCQDQTHVFIAAARALGVPTRYVVGYLRDAERPDGEHDPHAWAESWVDGLGWVAFDCTLGHCPAEGHVRLCCGLDAADAAPIRGVMLSMAETRLSHDVQIASLAQDDAAQAQTQQ